MTSNNHFSMGWLPDYPDFRDYSITNDLIVPLLKTIQVDPKSIISTVIPSFVDNRKWCSPVESQGNINSCTAHAGVGIMEYYENRAYGKHINASRLFLYKVTRNLIGMIEDSGAFLRTTMGAMSCFGVLPEKYWQYTDIKPDFNIEPPAFCYSMAQNYQAIKYAKLDLPGVSKEDLLKTIKTNLAAGIPSMFGFTVYDSIRFAVKTGEIPFPAPRDTCVGGHAVMAVGYNDDHQVPGAPNKGAILIRNSWGEGWGEDGYGWLPYDYIYYNLAIDWWILLQQEWLDTEKFGL